MMMMMVMMIMTICSFHLDEVERTYCQWPGIPGSLCEYTMVRKKYEIQQTTFNAKPFIHVSFSLLINCNIHSLIS